MAIWKYIRTPFGASGDRAAIPNDAQPDGSVSQTEGFGINYQLDPVTDPDALNVPRDKFNEIEYDNQVGIQQLQQESDPRFITSSDNGGVAFSYKAGVRVRFTGGWAGAGELTYYSLVDANTTTPTDATKCGLVQYAAPYFTGFEMPWSFSTLPDAGWVWKNGTTIGNASSNATQRANADTQALFYKLWGDYPTTLQLFDSSGNPVARGVSAAADWAANRAIAMPDMCGRTFVGADNMGGIPAKNRVTVAGSGIAGTTIGATGGVETVQLTANQNGQHTHTATTDSAGTHTHSASTDSAGTHDHTASAGSAGTHSHGSLTANFSEDDNPDPPYLSVIGNNLTGVPATLPSSGTGSAGAHTHPITVDSAGAHTHPVTVQNAGAHTHPVTVQNSGTGAAHQNMQPSFIGGGWIMKL